VDRHCISSARLSLKVDNATKVTSMPNTSSPEIIIRIQPHIVEPCITEVTSGK